LVAGVGVECVVKRNPPQRGRRAQRKRKVREEKQEEDKRWKKRFRGR
jgi:hypothetical protein